MPEAIWLGIIGAVLTMWLTGSVRRYALTRNILDIPNQRSSHTVPTPLGGGLAIAAVVIGGIMIWGVFGRIGLPVAIALGGGSVFVAIVGWIDDRDQIAPLPRVALHFVAATWTVVWLGGFSTLRVGSAEVSLGWGGSVIAIVAIVWAINLYNFMDGIDGLASTEAISVGVVGGVVLFLGGSAGLAGVAFLVAGAALGFLRWNYPPARIFMGDVGSGMIGFLVAGLALSGEALGGVPAWLWVILLGVFVFDATATLLRRMLRGERWYTAHRSHAYQRLVQAGWGHGAVSWSVLTLNLVLGAFAILALFYPSQWLLVAALVVVILTACYLAVERIRPWDSPTAGSRGR